MRFGALFRIQSMRLNQLGYTPIMLVLIKEAKASRYTPFHRHPCSRIGHQPGFRPFQTQAGAIGASRVRNLVFTKKVKLHGNLKLLPLCLHNRFRLTPMDIPTR